MLAPSTITHLYSLLRTASLCEAKVEKLRQRVCSHYPEEVFLPRLLFDGIIAQREEEEVI